MSRYAILTLLAIALAAASCGHKAPAEGVIYSCDEYTLTADSIVAADGTVAKAVSPYEIVSTYRAPERPLGSNEVHFTFMLNGELKEFADSARAHRLRIVGDPAADSTVFMLGEATLSDNLRFAAADSGSMPFNTRFTFRVDARPMLKSFRKRGYYIIRHGDTIRRRDFHGIWLHGDNPAISATAETDPEGFAKLKMHDRGDSIYELTVTLNPAPEPREYPRRWSIESAPENIPVVTTGQTLPDALYNMSASFIAADSLSELTPAAILLTMAYLDPERSLQAVKRHIADGVFADPTLGYWPVDAGRIAWILAGWEVYKVTGDRAWGRELYDAAAATLDEVFLVSVDPQTGLMGGGIVPPKDYCDYYPSWMGPAEIAKSNSLTANVMLSQVCSAMAALGDILGENVAVYRNRAARLMTDINLQLWIPHRGHYSQYLYGGAFPMQSPYADNLGQALAIISGIAIPEMADRIFEKAPATVYGIPAVWPKPVNGDRLYYNVCRADVQAFWAIAAARSRRVEPLQLSLASMMRAQALMVDTPPYIDVNSGAAVTDSVTAAQRLNAAAVYAAPIFRIIAGMEFTPRGLQFNPVIPPQLSRVKKIEGFRYRGATLDIAIRGTGSRVTRFAVDGVSHADRLVPSDLTGRHTVEIIMASNDFESSTANVVDSIGDAPAVPSVTFRPDGSGQVNGFNRELKYQVWVNGVYQQEMDSAKFAPHDPLRFGALAISASNSVGEGYATRPMLYIPRGYATVAQANTIAEPGTRLVKEKSIAERMVESSSRLNPTLTFEINSEKGGPCLLDVSYSNGAGPRLFQSACAMREVIVNEVSAGFILMPQLGSRAWEVTAYSTMLRVDLHPGVNTVTLAIPAEIPVPKSPVLIEKLRVIPLAIIASARRE